MSPRTSIPFTSQWKPDKYSWGSARGCNAWQNTCVNVSLNNDFTGDCNCIDGSVQLMFNDVSLQDKPLNVHGDSAVPVNNDVENFVFLNDNVDNGVLESCNTNDVMFVDDECTVATADVMNCEWNVELRVNGAPLSLGASYNLYITTCDRNKEFTYLLTTAQP